MRWRPPAPAGGRHASGSGVVDAGFRVALLLRPADRLLDLALDLLRLALDLLAGVTGRGACRAAHPAFHPFGRALELVLHALGRQVLVIAHLALLFGSMCCPSTWPRPGYDEVTGLTAEVRALRPVPRPPA